MEALPTSPISGSRQLCDLFSLSSRFSPVTYRLRDNSPTLSPSGCKAGGYCSRNSPFASSFSSPVTPQHPFPGSAKFGASSLLRAPPPTTGGVSGQGSAAVPAHRPQPNLCPPAPGAILATAPALFCAVT